jgi:hypothetical protein
LHFDHSSAHTKSSVQLMHFSQLEVPSHGDKPPVELLVVELDDELVVDENDPPPPPWPNPPAPPIPSSTTTLAPHAVVKMVRAPSNLRKKRVWVILPRA